ncbi:hypothetical protein CCACVL1_23259, partial [Corchorus capsularis]
MAGEGEVGGEGSRQEKAWRWKVREQVPTKAKGPGFLSGEVRRSLIIKKEWSPQSSKFRAKSLSLISCDRRVVIKKSCLSFWVGLLESK